MPDNDVWIGIFSQNGEKIEHTRPLRYENWREAQAAINGFTESAQREGLVLEKMAVTISDSCSLMHVQV